MAVMKKEIEQVRQGLLRMKNKPDGFLFLDCEANGRFTYDEKEIFEIPVFHHPLMTNENEILFIPMWKEDGDCHIVDIKRFNSGYSESEQD